MEFTEIMSAISTIGFPIAACVGMFYLYNETITKITNSLDKLNETLTRFELRLDKIEDQIEKIG